MGMTLKERLTKGEGTLSAQEAKALAAQCRMDVDTLYTLLEERGIKVLEEENEPSLDVDSIIAEVENAENNNDDMGLAEGAEVDGVGPELIATGGGLGLRQADGGDLGRREDVRGDAATLQRDDGVAERVEDRGAPLHGGH